MLVVIKGAGDLATGIAHRLKMSGFDIVMTEIENPTVVRHTVSFASAVIRGEAEVEGLKARLCKNIEDIRETINEGRIALVVDPEARVIKDLKPHAVVDAIIAKKNLSTSIDDAPIVIGVGPGFEAGRDVDYVVETKRGHYIGKIITSGSAIENTSVPGNIEGFTSERVIRNHKAGSFRPKANIGDMVNKGDIVGFIDGEPVLARIDGVVRGMLMDEMEVGENFKCGDIDPRRILDHCYTISDKARAIGGGVLEAIMRGEPRDDQ